MSESAADYMEAHVVASLYAEIINGIPKESSRFVDQPDFEATWDEISEQIETIKAEDPEAQFDVPNEMPEPDTFQPEGEEEGAEKPAVDSLKAKVAPAPAGGSAVSNLKAKATEA